MRVTNQLLNSVSRDSLLKVGDKQLGILEQGNSGVRINRPSDDPIAYMIARAYDKQLESNAQYTENNAIAMGWLESQSTSTGQFKKIMDSFFVLAEQAATDTTATDQLDTIAFDMRQLLKQMVSVVNTNFNDSSIFAGTDFNSPAYEEGYAVDSTIEGITFTGSSDKTISIEVPPTTVGTIPSATPLTFILNNDDGTKTDIILAPNATTLDLGNGNTIDFTSGTVLAGAESIAVRPAVIYKGSNNSNNDFSIEIMEDQIITVNGVGSNIFGGLLENASGALEPSLTNETNAFEVLSKMISAVERHDRGGIRDLLTPMKESMTHVINYQASVGGKINRLDIAKGMVENSTATATEARSDLQDVNAIWVIEEQKNLELQYSLVAQLYSRMSTMNIMNFL